MGLSKKRRVFVEEYLKCWNATRAAKAAGYAYPRRQGSRLLTFVDVQAEIEQRLAEKAMGADEVLARLGDQARGSVEDFIEFKSGVKEPYLNLEQARERNLLHLIKKLKYNAQGFLEIELYDAQSALALIGRKHKLFTDKVEHSGSVEVKDGLTDQQRIRSISALIESLRAKDST